MPVVLFAVAGAYWRWMVDDGFIYLRVVQQLRNGNGPVFNPGERVEAFTSPSWLALLTIADVVTPVRLEWLAIGLGVACSAAGLALAMAGSARLARLVEPGSIVVPLGALVVLALIPMWIFQTSGLESGLVFAWLGGCMLVLGHWSSSGRAMPWWGAVVIGLGWLVRPELVLTSALFVLTVLVAQWRRSGWWGRLTLVGAAVAVPLLYQLFRMAYYGSLVSNPAIAKEAVESSTARGLDYLRDLAGPYWLWVPALVLVAGGYLPLLAGLRRSGASRAQAVVVAFVAAALVHGAFVVRAGGDWMHARLLLPAVFMLATPVAVVPWAKRYAAGLLVVPWAVVCAVTMRPAQLGADAAVTDQFILLGPTDHRVTLADFGFETVGTRSGWYEGPAVYQSDAFSISTRRLDLEPRPSLPLPTVAAGGIGRLSYAIGPDFRVRDTLGLADVLASHMEATPSRGPFERKPGHEKPLPTVWLAALLTPEGTRPAPEQFRSEPNPAIPPTTGPQFQEQVAWARAVLRCPDVRELLDSTAAPLSAGRVARNLVGSFERTTLRIPPDPEQAHVRFCGDDVPPDVEAARAGD
jgi:arabinofuranosyltransferase